MKKNVPGKSVITIQWLEKAVDDLEALREHIGHDNPPACERVTKRIMKAVNLLVGNPEMGRTGRVINTRELILSGLPYIIFYRTKNNRIEILRVFHGAMQWPE